MHEAAMRKREQSFDDCGREGDCLHQRAPSRDDQKHCSTGVLDAPYGPPEGGNDWFDYVVRVLTEDLAHMSASQPSAQVRTCTGAQAPVQLRLTLNDRDSRTLVSVSADERSTSSSFDNPDDGVDGALWLFADVVSFLPKRGRTLSLRELGGIYALPFGWRFSWCWFVGVARLAGILLVIAPNEVRGTYEVCENGQDTQA
jgi:hypothetical protein